MFVRNAMTELLVTVGPSHSLREAAVRMTARDVGAAVVIDPEGEGPGVLTERDVLHAAARGQDLDSELVADHLSPSALTCHPTWSLERAAELMAHHQVRHVLVCDGHEVVGMISVRDIVRSWASDGATCDLPEPGRFERQEIHPDRTPTRTDPNVDVPAQLRRMEESLDGISGF